MLAISLPEDLEARLEALAVTTGQSKAELVEEAIAAQIEDLEYAARDKASLETWLMTEGVAAYDRLKADPDSAVSADEVRARLSERRASRIQGGSLRVHVSNSWRY
jgi:antitoxin ParD1/3/4